MHVIEWTKKYNLSTFLKKEVITEVFNIVVKSYREFVSCLPPQPGLLCSPVGRYAVVTMAILKLSTQLLSKSGIHIPFDPEVSLLVVYTKELLHRYIQNIYNKTYTKHIQKNSVIGRILKWSLRFPTPPLIYMPA